MSEEKILRYRLCIVGEYMYLLKKWNSKNSYIIHKIFTKSVGKKSGNEAKKEKVSSLLFGNKAINKKAIRKMKEAGHEQIFQEYLDKEMVVQKQKTPAWNKKHAQYFANIEAEKKEFWKGDKEERAKLNRKMAESYARNSKNSASKKAGNVSITLTNSRSDVIHVFWRADSQERKATINGRGSTTISVPAGMKLYYSVNKNNTKQGFMTAPNSGSGKYRF